MRDKTDKMEVVRVSAVQAIADIVIFLVLAAAFCVLEVVVDPPAIYRGLISIIGAFASVCIVLAIRQQPIVELGLWRPRRLLTLPLWVIVIFLVTGVLAGGAQMIAAQFVDQQIDLSRFQALHQNLPMLLIALASIWITAAFFEEIVFRGFLLGRLKDLFGSGFIAAVSAVIMHAVLFGVLHMYQGVLGVITTGVVALIFGAFFLLLKRNLWALIIVHGLIDTISVIQFYLIGVPDGTLG